jgi:hypothetical protein
LKGEGVDAANAIAPQARITGVSVQEMVADGVEVIIGVNCDPQLGPVLLFGSGGVMVEVYNDVALRRCPITRAEAQAMIAEVKGARLLQGFRGRPAADRFGTHDRRSALAAGTALDAPLQPLADAGRVVSIGCGKRSFADISAPSSRLGEGVDLPS